MISNDMKSQVDGAVASTFAAITAMLEEKQRKIEEETGQKLSLEELFHLYRNVILGKEKASDVIIPGMQHETFPDGLPGYRFSQELGYFLPDIPALSMVSNWSRLYYPSHTYSHEEIEQLTDLYLDPLFQRTSSSLQGRIRMMIESEGMSKEEFAASITEENSAALLFNLSPMFVDTDEGRRALDLLVLKYGSIYGEQWIRGNEPPLGKAFLSDEWPSGRLLKATWWKYAAPELEHEKGIRGLEFYDAEKIDRELKWLYCQHKFSKLSGSLAGRMDILCAMGLVTPDELAGELGIPLDVLKQVEKNHDEIVEALIQRYGGEHGAVWLAFGLEGLDMAFALHAISGRFGFLRAIPAIFRPSRYAYQRMNPDTELSGAGEPERCCLNCGQPFTGRSDKRFHSGACQRAYYRKQARQEYLNGLDGEDEVEDRDEQQQEQQEEPKKEGFVPLLGDALGDFANMAAGMFLEQAVKHYAERMFGSKPD